MSKIGHFRPIGSKNGSRTYGPGDFGYPPTQHPTQLPWPNQDPIRGKTGDGRRLLLHLLYGVCIPLGHSDRQHADLGGYVLHNQEAVC